MHIRSQSPSADSPNLIPTKAKDQFGIIFKSWLPQKGCDWLAVCAVVAAPSDSDEAVNICRRSESPWPCCPTLISLPPQPGRAAASARAQLPGAQADLWTSAHDVWVRLKSNRQTLRAPNASKSVEGTKPAGHLPRSNVPHPPASELWGLGLITYCLHNSGGGPAGRQPAIRSCPCPRSLSGSQAGGPCRRGLPCRWPCRRTEGGEPRNR